ncbi:alpha/beta hydrolase [Williamsoniiplasma lucivorax]|uniref:Hydrolase n=1 Tax=Williamsoniiplasma lucivorax TaxID=209274 RepID=A0A2S5RE07_9MOLU|nr:alpha/beta hydrolase [Williamsoniiplasma lucivorax]PPE05528.1 hydrolase [Williamsoniiplasma lucivorax]
MAQESKKYQYNWKTVLWTILFFPVVWWKSKQVFKEHKFYKYTFPRSGEWKEARGISDPIPMAANTYEYHLWDLQRKNLSLVTFTPEQITEFILPGKFGGISCVQAINPASDKWVIGLHGWTQNKYAALRYMYYFYEQGYNILTFDAYGHGLSYGEFHDSGYSTIPMLDDLVAYLLQDHQAQVIGLIGLSMGATSAILYSQIGQHKAGITWIIEDCAPSHFTIQNRWSLQQKYQQPWWLITFRLTAKLSKITQTPLKDYDLNKRMSFNAQTPIFFIHMLEDTWVPVWMGKEMYAEKIKFETQPNWSELWTPSGSEHCYYSIDHKQDYVDRTLGFIHKIEQENAKK